MGGGVTISLSLKKRNLDEVSPLVKNVGTLILGGNIGCNEVFIEDLLSNEVVVYLDVLGASMIYGIEG
jgi:hypothetical protein